MTAVAPGAHTEPISGHADPPASERLGRRWFAAVARGAYDELPNLVHDDVELVSRIRAGAVVHGRAQVAEFIRETVAPSLFDAAVDVYTAIDDERAIAEGRIRWMDDDRVIRDDPVVWALEFKDGKLRRFIAVRTLREAEAVLGVSP